MEYKNISSKFTLQTQRKTEYGEQCQIKQVIIDITISIYIYIYIYNTKRGKSLKVVPFGLTYHQNLSQ